MDPLLPRLEDEERRRRGRLLFRHNKIPVRMLVPNFFTLLSLCAGLTAIRMAIELRYEMAIALVVIAALLDGVDGRLARALQGPIQVRRRARQPGRLRQFRRRAGRDRVRLGARRPAARLRLDRGPGVRARYRPAARPVQHHDRRGETEMAGRVFHRHAGARGRHHGAAAALLDNLGIFDVRTWPWLDRRLHAGHGAPAGIDHPHLLRQADGRAHFARVRAADVCWRRGWWRCS